MLDSPYNVALRRELPAESAAKLASINIIENIERVILASEQTETLIVLEGTFDVTSLKETAAREGAVITQYKDAEILAASDAGEQDVAMAIAAPRFILLGRSATLADAIDRAATARALNRAAGFDLWVATEQAAAHVESSEVGWQIGPTLRVSGRLRLRHPIIGDLPLEAFTATGDGRNMQFAAEFKSPAEYAPFAGRIRTLVESAQPYSAPVNSSGKIRIYGLEEGVREIPLTKSK